MKKVDILNLQINETTVEKALSNVAELASSNESGYVCFVNAHMTVEANKDDFMLNVVNSAHMALPDGAPIAKSFKFLYGIKQKRLAGMDFLPLMLGKAESENLNVSIFGSSNEVLAIATNKIKEEYPKLNLVLTISPPFDKDWDNKKYIKQINDSKTNVLFVALGCPKQEKWMYKNRENINAVMLGIGGALPVFVEKVSRSPQWMQNNGLEWFYRLIKEPKRMWKRYLITNPIFLKLFIIRFFKKRFFNF